MVGILMTALIAPMILLFGFHFFVAKRYIRARANNDTFVRILIGASPVLVPSLLFVCGLYAASGQDLSKILPLARQSVGVPVACAVWGLSAFFVIASVDALIGIVRGPKKRFVPFWAALAVAGVLALQWGTAPAGSLPEKTIRSVEKIVVIETGKAYKEPSSLPLKKELSQVVVASENWILDKAGSKTPEGYAASTLAAVEGGATSLVRLVFGGFSGANRYGVTFGTFKIFLSLLVLWMVLNALEGGMFFMRKLLIRMGLIKPRPQDDPVAAMTAAVMNEIEIAREAFDAYQHKKLVDETLEKAKHQVRGIFRTPEAEVPQESAPKKMEMTPELKAEIEERIRSIR